jgi:hypothetical protein
MRVVREIQHPLCKITIFAWNNRFILKLEQGTLEQTFKIDATDLTEDEVIKLADEKFMALASRNFMEMGRALQEAIARSSN